MCACMIYKLEKERCSPKQRMLVLESIALGVACMRNLHNIRMPVDRIPLFMHIIDLPRSRLLSRHLEVCWLGQLA